MAYIYDLTDTWNASGTTFNGIKLNVTDSASASSSKLVTLQTNGTEHFSITKAGVGYFSGNVGVNCAATALANYRGFELAGAATTQGGFLRMRTSDSSVNSLDFLDTNGRAIFTTTSHPIRFGTSDTERARIDSSGRLFLGATTGVGNDQMLVAFNSSGSITQAINMRDTNASGNGNSFLVLRRSDDTYLGAIGRSGTDSAMFVDGNSYLTFRTGGSERARIDSAGRVLIGTTATVGGTWSNEVKQTSSGVWPWGLNCVDRGLIVRNSSASTGYYAYFEYNGGTNNGSISWSGGTTSYNTTSDYRLKNINGPLTNSGAYIDALNPVEGSWKADGKRFIGLLAHQVQEVSQTSVVVGEKDGAEMQQMDYSAPELIANLIAEVQSLRARVAQLEGN